MKATPVFNENEKIEKSYHYDDGHYAVQHGNVFKMVDDEGYVFTDEISISQLEIYGEELIEKPVILDLKVLLLLARMEAGWNLYLKMKIIRTVKLSMKLGKLVVIT